MPQLSEYELERQANIARNKALIDQLDLKAAVDDLGVPATKVAPKTKAKPIQPAKRARKEQEAEAPRRQSARLRGSVVDPNESPSKKRKREKEEQERRAIEEEERLEAEERARLAKRPRHEDLDIPTLVEEVDPQELSGLNAVVNSVIAADNARRTADVDAFDLKGDKHEKAAVADLRERLQSLKVVARAKVTLDRVYSAAYHPEVTKDLVFFGDKHGQLGIWDARAPSDEAVDEDGEPTSQEDKEGGKYWRLQPHWPATSKSSISCVKMDPINAHTVYTSSYDCTVRALSFETGISYEVHNSEDTLISCIDLPSAGNEMWISDALGGVTHLDLRENKTKPRWYQLSDQKIGALSLNPTNPVFLLTASNSRSLKIWDIRRLTGIAGKKGESDFEYDAVESFVGSSSGKGILRGDWKHGKSVSAAYWDPRGRSIVSTSYDDILRLWDINTTKFDEPKPFPSFRPFSQIRHSCQTGRWVTVFKAQWSPDPEVYPHFTVGNMDHSIDIFSCKGDSIAKLANPSKISAVQAVTCSHPNVVERVVSGNASGRCVLWAPADLA